MHYRWKNNFFIADELLEIIEIVIQNTYEVNEDFTISKVYQDEIYIEKDPRIISCKDSCKCENEYFPKEDTMGIIVNKLIRPFEYEEYESVNNEGHFLQLMAIN